MPTLDAGHESVYQRINRPRPELTLDRLVKGLEAFRREFAGRLWIEVMLVKRLNDTEESLHQLAAVLDRIRPDEVHVTLPVRPPAEAWVEPPDDETLDRVAKILHQHARVFGGSKAAPCASDVGDLEMAALAILIRHPMTRNELAEVLWRWDGEQVDAALARLGAAGRIRQVQRTGRAFWTSAEARYGWDPAGERSFP